MVCSVFCYLRWEFCWKLAEALLFHTTITHVISVSSTLISPSVATNIDDDRIH